MTKPRIIQNTGDYEWYTPPRIIKAATDVFYGKINLDPASCEIANENLVKADVFFDEATDGLKRDWYGKIWLNPPYKRGLIDAFADKVVEEYKSGRTTEAIILTNNSSETKWYQKLLSEASAICLVSGRVRFYKPKEGTLGEVQESSPLQGQIVTYLGENDERFCEKFADIGTCLLHSRCATWEE